MKNNNPGSEPPDYSGPLMNGNRLETAPVASRGRMNSVYSVLVGPDYDVEWIFDHNPLGRAVTGYNLIKKASHPSEGQVFVDPATVPKSKSNSRKPKSDV